MAAAAVIGPSRSGIGATGSRAGTAGLDASAMAGGGAATAVVAGALTGGWVTETGGGASPP